jgi:hypothetical protein
MRQLIATTSGGHSAIPVATRRTSQRIKEPKEDDQGDKSHNAKFQDDSKTINIIFGGDDEFSSRTQKLLLREIMFVELAVP